MRTTTTWIEAAMEGIKCNVRAAFICDEMLLDHSRDVASVRPEEHCQGTALNSFAEGSHGGKEQVVAL